MPEMRTLQFSFKRNWGFGILLVSLLGIVTTGAGLFRAQGKITQTLQEDFQITGIATQIENAVSDVKNASANQGDIQRIEARIKRLQDVTMQWNDGELHQRIETLMTSFRAFQRLRENRIQYSQSNRVWDAADQGQFEKIRDEFHKELAVFSDVAQALKSASLEAIRNPIQASSTATPVLMLSAFASVLALLIATWVLYLGRTSTLKTGRDPVLEFNDDTLAEFAELISQAQSQLDGAVDSAIVRNKTPQNDKLQKECIQHLLDLIDHLEDIKNGLGDPEGNTAMSPSHVLMSTALSAFIDSGRDTLSTLTTLANVEQAEIAMAEDGLARVQELLDAVSRGLRKQSGAIENQDVIGELRSDTAA